MSLQATTILFVTLVVLAASLVTGLLIGEREVTNARSLLSDRAMNTAEMVANSPIVIDSLQGQGNTTEVESFTNRIQRVTDVRFIVVMDMNHIRKSHPNPSEIGKKFVGGDEDAAMHGHSYVSVAKGTLGTSLRAFTPIRSSTGRQIGVVCVGIMMNHVETAIAQSEYIIYIGISVGLIIGIVGAVLLARKIKTILFGLEPSEIANLFQERNAMLESVREGILAVNRNGRVEIANAEAIRLFGRAGIFGDPIGSDIEEYLPTSRLRTVLTSGTPEFDKELDINGVTFVVNRVPVEVDGQIVGAIGTFRDKTELKTLAEQLTGVKLYAEALRVQTHESMNKFHVILGLVHTGQYDRLSGYIREITNQYQMEIGVVSRLVKEPILAGFLLSKLSYAREHDVEFKVAGEAPLPQPKQPDLIHDLITILGNLIDNAFEAVQGSKQKSVGLMLNYADGIFTFSVKDTGGGIPTDLTEISFAKGFSTKGENRGFGLYLVKLSVNRLHGTLTLETSEAGTQFVVSLPYEGKGESE